MTVSEVVIFKKMMKIKLLWSSFIRLTELLRSKTRSSKLVVLVRVSFKYKSYVFKLASPGF